MLKCLCSGISVLSIAFGTVPLVHAAVDVDITFDVGAMPADEGFASGGNVDPTTNISGGVWDNNLVAGNGSFLTSTTAYVDVDGPIFHGWSDIKIVSSSGAAADDRTLLAWGRGASEVGAGNEYGFILYFAEGTYSILGFIDGFVGVHTLTFAVGNTDSEFHQYGWEVDETTKTVRLFFDGSQVGSDVVLIGAFSATAYLGDATGGGDHHDVWDRVVISEGLIPEPASIGILALGSLLILFGRKSPQD